MFSKSNDTNKGNFVFASAKTGVTSSVTPSSLITTIINEQTKVETED